MSRSKKCVQSGPVRWLSGYRLVKPDKLTLIPRPYMLEGEFNKFFFSEFLLFHSLFCYSPLLIPPLLPYTPSPPMLVGFIST